MDNMLQKLVWKIIPPFEVKVTREEISAFLVEHASLSKQIIMRDALALIKNAEKTVFDILAG
ncbi:MAG TPA: hypothetical protein VK572_13800 [Burkholderiales bacterium]|nr:hypothetical protein [Burkholderiales bacterium]